ncbi:MAG: YARHG domain-containing protein, partial [Pyrinomonadaceae bacterium]
KIDYTKTLLTKSQISELGNGDDEAPPFNQNELALLRGIIFGKKGRIFVNRGIQNYLKTRSWYKPDPNFSNASLSETERKNIDLVRLAEAEKNRWIQPGDMRIWQNKEIPSSMLFAASATGWRILVAEVEAIHGKRFDSEPWLQRYFEERYWYKADPDYTPDRLNSTERKNIETMIAERNSGRNVELAVGDMDRFTSEYLKEEHLKGLTFSELRLLRNEIFARHGYKFSAPGISQYFDWRDWYSPIEDNSKIKLNEFEESNVKTLLAAERQMREAISKRKLNEDELMGLFIEDLKIMRNEIFAKHGKVFSDPDLISYFSGQSWYKPNPEFKDSDLSQIELENVEVIKNAEEMAVSRFDLFEG